MSFDQVIRLIKTAVDTAKLIGEIPKPLRSLRSRVVQRFPRTVTAHRERLRHRLNRLPFIYRGVEANTEADYVQASVAPTDLRTLDAFGYESSDRSPLGPVGADQLEDFEQAAAHLMVSTEYPYPKI